MSSQFASFQMKASAPKRGGLAAFEDSDDDEGPALAPQLLPQELQEQGNAAAAAGNWSLALRRWDEALAQRPADIGHLLHEQKAQVYLEVGDPWRAIQSATAATQLRPSWAEGHLTLARAQLNFGEPELALRSFNTVLQLEPGNVEASEEINTVRMLVLQRKRQPASAAGAGARGGGSSSGGGGSSSERLRVVGQQPGGEEMQE